MKKKFLLLIQVFLIVYGHFRAVAQTNPIEFESKLSWKEVKDKARNENKYIFIDCYATWCAPCKDMDQTVFSSDKVGALVNKTFISVKLQLDTTSMDDPQVKTWYFDAFKIRNYYNITTIPTYLFFSSNGKLVHRGSGYKELNDFLSLVMEATDSSKQYYTLLRKYREGYKDYDNMAYLALTAKKLNQYKLSNSIAKDYKDNYMSKLNDTSLFAKENFEFLSHYPDLINSNDRYFRLLYNHSDTVDKIMNWNGFSDYHVKYTIKREEIDEELWATSKANMLEPDWDNINRAISSKFNNHFAEILLPSAQLEFYKRKRNWRKYAGLLETLIKKSPPAAEENNFAQLVSGLNAIGKDAWSLNVESWGVFLNCTDTTVLSKALSWINLAIALQPNNNIQFLDTKANLLYKLGFEKEAIALEKEAIKIDAQMEKPKGREKGYFYDEFTKTLSKMEKGEPTWNITEESNL